MSKEEFYVAKWVTVEGEVEAKRFQSSSYPRVESHSSSATQNDGPTLLDIYADERRVLTVHSNCFIHISREG
jgi:hypothetical protein